MFLKRHYSMMQCSAYAYPILLCSCKFTPVQHRVMAPGLSISPGVGRRGEVQGLVGHLRQWLMNYISQLCIHSSSIHFIAWFYHTILLLLLFHHSPLSSFYSCTFIFMFSNLPISIQTVTHLLPLI